MFGKNNDYDKPPSYDFSLQFKSGVSKSINAFLSNMKNFESVILAAAKENSKLWFGKSTMSDAALDVMWNPTLKYRKDKETGDIDYNSDPTLKVKLPKWDGKWGFELFDTDNKLIFSDKNKLTDGREPPETQDILQVFPKATHVKGLIELGNMWFVGNRFGITWRLVKAVVRPPVRLANTGVNDMLSDSDDDEMESKLNAEDAEYETSGGSGLLDDDSDEDDDGGPTFEQKTSVEDEDDSDEEEVVVAPPKVKKKKKKIVRKKKVAVPAV